MSDRADKAEPTAISFNNRDGKIFVAGPWPAVTIAAAALLKGDVPFASVEGGIAVFSVENGMAEYKIRDVASDPLVMDLLPDSVFEAEQSPNGGAGAAEKSPASDTTDATLTKGTGEPAAAITGAYDGPAVGQEVTHLGERKKVHATRHSAAGSEASFDGKQYHSVSEMKPIS